MQVIAHRGANREALENSWSAFELAVDGGALRIELDVQLTADGHAAVMHDDDFSRTAERPGRLSALTRAQVAKIKLRNGEAIPFLDEVVAKLLPRIELNIEIKGRSTELARVVAETVANFARIDLLVNNAGVAPKVRADLLDAGEESFDRLYAINLKGPFFLTQLVAKQMLKQAPDAEGFRGRIVNITSISVYTASINRGDYCMVKAGLAMMTKLFADRLANDGINVYEIRPGVIATDMTGGVKEKYDKLIITDERGITPLRRWGQPADIGRAVRAIAEDRFPFSTGAVFDVDGGFHLHRL